MKHASAIDISEFDNYSWDLLVNLLQCSHKLEVLLINKKSQKYAKGHESRWRHPLLVPECLVHLKTLCLREYQGLETELDFVRSLGSEEKLKTCNHLSKLQRNFETCHIVFH
ncbi:hypothetical protein PHAVU_005G069400 [Phaseolus vulgaris]|uniref:FBD domain-containing protein n=1 Tax=Phaseolus vulgaris TaxID=3885 RepID=V7BWK0_PHAVU|nr:hypothetical protein PHAVU_005G069400g [Phaseolus vulgaris]ESW21420.1 hypothetical protein PHAVU_005G069400g [Phaseolus vulgaris]